MTLVLFKSKQGSGKPARKFQSAFIGKETVIWSMASNKSLHKI